MIAAGSDVICIEGNMANGSMAGPRLFEEFVMPYEDLSLIHIYVTDGGFGDKRRILHGIFLLFRNLIPRKRGGIHVPIIRIVKAVVF